MNPQLQPTLNLFPAPQNNQQQKMPKRKPIRNSQQSSSSGISIIDSEKLITAVMPKNRLPGRKIRLASESSVSELEPEPNYGQPLPFGLDNEDDRILLLTPHIEEEEEENTPRQVGKPVYDIDSSVYDEHTSPTMSREYFDKELDEAYKKQVWEF